MLPLEHAASPSFRPAIGLLLPKNVAVLVALLRLVVIPIGWPPSLPERSALTPVVALAILRAVIIAISRSRPDFEFIQLVPFRVGPIALRNGKKLANPATHIDWLHFIHLDIKSHNSPPIQQFTGKKTNP